MHRITTHALSAAALIGLTLASVSPAAAAPLAHMVFFTLADDTPENRATLVAACEKHLSDQDGTIHFSVGEIAEDLDRGVNDTGFDVALHLVFESRAAHDRYQTHPRHLKFIDEAKSLWSKVRVFDSNLVTPTE